MNIAIIVVYLFSMLIFGIFGKKRAVNASDYFVAGRRLGGIMFTGTFCAVLIGGASTVGGVGLGYTYGLSAMWYVISFGIGTCILSVFLAPRIQRMRIFTIPEFLRRRYGNSEMISLSGVVMLLYTVMLSVSSTIAYSSIFHVLFGLSRNWGIALGGIIVLCYSSLGGMWSITIADMVQFMIKTVGFFLLLLPFCWHYAGGWVAIKAHTDAAHISLFSIGWHTIISYQVIYALGMLIGQDIWQRVMTARSPRIARWGGVASSVYCVAYGIAGACIGLTAHELFPQIDNPDNVYAMITVHILPAGISGIVLAAAIAAMMSTASSGLIAASTILSVDIIPLVKYVLSKSQLRRPESIEHMPAHRWSVVFLGIVCTLISIIIPNVVSALSIAYDVLVGGLLVPIIGGIIWPVATLRAAILSMILGTLTTIIALILYQSYSANEPIYWGVGISCGTFLLGTCMTNMRVEKSVKLSHTITEIKHEV